MRMVIEMGDILTMINEYTSYRDKIYIHNTYIHLYIYIYQLGIHPVQWQNAHVAFTVPSTTQEKKDVMHMFLKVVQKKKELLKYLLDGKETLNWQVSIIDLNNIDLNLEFII